MKLQDTETLHKKLKKNMLRSKVGLKCGVSCQVYRVTGGKVMNYKNYYNVNLGWWKLCVIRILSY